MKNPTFQNSIAFLLVVFLVISGVNIYCEQENFYRTKEDILHKVYLSPESYFAAATDAQRVYGKILLYPDKYAQYYAFSTHIPSQNAWSMDSGHDAGSYCFAVHNICRDGAPALLLGCGLTNDTPQILINILQYDKKTGGIIDMDGDRTYPLMDNLIFYENGYFSTQNGISDLYMECWRLDDQPGRYRYGWERKNAFYETDGQSAKSWDPAVLPQDTATRLQWYEITQEAIIKQLFMHKSAR